jgi:hypothetical protein
LLGDQASKKYHSYGVKLHLIVTGTGYPVESILSLVPLSLENNCGRNALLFIAAEFGYKLHKNI